MAEQLFDGFTQAELRTAFDTVVPQPRHWKDPIEAVIDAADYGVTAKAVEFFTATKLSFVTMPNGRLAVTAPGYRAGPAGDH